MTDGTIKAFTCTMKAKIQLRQWEDSNFHHLRSQAISEMSKILSHQGSRLYRTVILVIWCCVFNIGRLSSLKYLHINIGNK